LQQLSATPSDVDGDDDDDDNNNNNNNFVAVFRQY
jgi:hypothetical protein